MMPFDDQGRVEKTTSNYVACPNCGKPVDPQERNCQHCGVDLALAAVMAERALASVRSISTEAPLTPEILVPRLGEYMLEKGVLSPQDLQRSLDYHNQLAAQGKPRLLGQVLLELGLVERETLDQVVTEQILQLQNALQLSNRQLEQRVRERTIDLQNALNKLSELNQLKSNFISSISHELRTPLTHIKGYLTLLEDGSLGSLTLEQREALDVLIRAEDRLESVIENLIQFSLVARGELSLNLEMVNITNLLHRTVNRSEIIAKKREIDFRVVLPESNAYIQADKEKISWALVQLQDNAIKFTPKGGVVKVEATIEGGLVTTSITDTGIGIAPERLEEIFEPFHQLDGSSSRQFGGTGLGLALVRQIIEAHGTVIKVHSVLGKGTRFEFSLPEVILENV